MEIDRLTRKLEVANDCLDLKKNFVDARSFEQWERCVMIVFEQRSDRLPLSTACRTLSINRSTIYARQRVANDSQMHRSERRSRKTIKQPRALREEEREKVIEIFSEKKHHDQPPAQVCESLLEKEECLCSVSRMPEYYAVKTVMESAALNTMQSRDFSLQNRMRSGRGIVCRRGTVLRSFGIVITELQAQKEMVVGPPESAVGSRLQTPSYC